ncbi:MAG: hypothetical protein J5626_10015 [Lachnospiraceae bacterium]|nr:hypothetical protein [Lachnospiraceae bacterium]
MKRIRRFFGIIFVMVLCAVSFAGCTSGEDSDVKLFKKEFTVGKDIERYNILDFYYTYENINYDASYQRYHIYKDKDGRHYFFHETRERKGDYGPCTREDTTKSEIIEITDEQWQKFYELVCDGTVREHVETADAGDSGPWYYLYWDKDKEKYREYKFPSYAAEKAFLAFCESLANDPIAVSAADFEPLDESYVGEWQGYFKTMSGQYTLTLGAPENGVFPAELFCVWNYSEDGDSGMYSGELTIKGSVSAGEDGVMMLIGTLDDGSTPKQEIPVKAALGKSGEGIKMIMIECHHDRIHPGNSFEFKRVK